MGLTDRLRRTLVPGDAAPPERHLHAALAAARAPEHLRDLVLAHGAWAVPLLAPLSPPETFSWQAHQERQHELAVGVERATDPERRAAAAYALVSLFLPRRSSGPFSWTTQHLLLAPLARRRLAWTPEQTVWLLEALARLTTGTGTGDFRELVRLPLAAAERLPEERRADVADVVARLLALADSEVVGWWDSAERARTVRRLRRLLPADGGEGPTTVPPHVLDRTDTYGPRARAALLERIDERSVARVLAHLGEYGSAVRPTRGWRRDTAALVAAVPASVDVARVLLETLRTQREAWVERRWGAERVRQPGFVSDASTLLNRAAAWLLADGSDAAWVTPLLGDVALHCGTGFGGSGGSARCGPVANSAVAALAERAGADADASVDVVAQLARVRAKVANKTIRTAVDKALTRAANAAGLSPGQLLERAVPAFGLDPDGTAERDVGDHTALLALTTGRTGARLAVRWRTPTGREVASVPAAVKQGCPEQLADVRALAREVKKAAATQRARLEDLLVEDRTWTGEEWVARYADHPVVGLTARALVWEGREGDGAWVAGLPERKGAGWVLRGHAGTVLGVGPGTTVRLWHPIRERLEEIRAWREHVTAQSLRQPFKQVFREIYLLTPAEEETGTYSNRFAAHVLRYPQAGALMRTRGWSGNHLGYWDGGFDGEAVKVLGDTGWRARFFYDLVEDDADGYETPALCSTDQVRLERRQGSGSTAGWDVASLAEVPPLVLSEAMRDVDLFVGVTSIAADPTWVDHCVDRFRQYWEQQSFGDLTQSAQMRREALARLLPRTTLAGRAELTDRFLVVHGHLRDYKVHLGSGNILMSPADTYLCIVPARGDRTSQVFLPFEEDGGLALILSKAFLLAEDTAITDPTITRQLRHGL